MLQLVKNVAIAGNNDVAITGSDAAIASSDVAIAGLMSFSQLPQHGHNQ